MRYLCVVTCDVTCSCVVTYWYLWHDSHVLTWLGIGVHKYCCCWCAVFFGLLWALCHFTGFARLIWGRSNVLAQFPHSEWFLHCLFLLYCRRQYAALLVYAWDDSSVCWAWLFCIGVLTRSHVWSDEFYVTRWIAVSMLHFWRTCHVTGSCVWCVWLVTRCHDSSVCATRRIFFSELVTWLIQICSRTHSIVCRQKSLNGTRRISMRHDAFVLMPWLICTYDVTRSCVWHDLFVCVSRLFWMSFMTHLCVWSDEFYMTRRIAASMLHFWRTRRSCVWRDCCVWLSWRIRVCDATHYSLWRVTRRIQMCARTPANKCRRNKAFCLQNSGK